MKVMLSEVIDELGVSKFTWRIFLLCGLALLFDGFDNMIVSYTMPQISKEWALTKLQTGSLASWSFLGLMVGAMCAGILSDRIGRKKTLILSCLIYSIFNGLIYFSPNFQVFAILRIISGFGLGACLPVGSTIVSEFVPSKNRGFLVAAIYAFFNAGWVLAGIVGVNVVPALGWRACFLFGCLPALYAIILAIWLYESPRWLLSKGRETEAIAIIQNMERTVKGVAGEWAPGSLIVPPPPKSVGLKALFMPEFRFITISFWIIYFMGTMVVYGIISWLPTLLYEKGYSLVKSYSFSILQNVAAVIGSSITGLVADKIGRRKNIMLGYAVTIVTIILLGFATTQWQVVLFAMFTGFIITFSMTGVQPLLAEAYPTEFRNTGVAWAQGFGRLGSFCGPLISGFVQQIGVGFTGAVSLFAIPAAICAFTIMLFRVETKGKTLESITSEIVK